MLSQNFSMTKNEFKTELSVKIDIYCGKRHPVGHPSVSLPLPSTVRKNGIPCTLLTQIPTNCKACQIQAVHFIPPPTLHPTGD